MINVCAMQMKQRFFNLGFIFSGIALFAEKLNIFCFIFFLLQGNNILQELSPEEYKSVINLIESCILSTDLAQYFK
uniref:PDEase domain-containing protein n=1 Tax=Tetranychus urticae TaxID=32264 RepID=T1KKV0_TETUR